MENDEIYTMERGSYLLVRINDNGDDANYDGNDVCRNEVSCRHSSSEIASTSPEVNTRHAESILSGSSQSFLKNQQPLERTRSINT